MSDALDLSVATQDAIAKEAAYRKSYIESNRDEVLRTGKVRYPDGSQEPLTTLEQQSLNPAASPAPAGMGSPGMAIGKAIGAVANIAAGDPRPAASLGVEAFSASVPAINAGASVWQAASDPLNQASVAMEEERRYRQQYAIDNWRELLQSPSPVIRYPNGAEEPLTDAEKQGVEVARKVEAFRAIQRDPAGAIRGTVRVDLPTGKQKLERSPDGSVRPVVDMEIRLTPAERFQAAKLYAAERAANGKGEGLYWPKRLPFGMAFDAMQFSDFKVAAERIARDDKTGSSTATEWDYLIVARLQQEAESRGKQSFWGKAWDSLTQVPGYVGEFIATSGAVNPVASATSKAVGREILKRTGSRMLARAGGGVAGTVVAEGGMRTLLRPTAVAAEATKAAAPEIGLADGRVSLTPGDSRGVALARGIGLTAAENISERTGEGLASLGGRVMRRLGFGQKTVAAALGADKEQNFRRFIQQQALWSGLPSEFAEEYASDLLSSPIIKEKDRPGNPVFMLMNGDWKGLAEDFALKAAVIVPTAGVMNHAGLAVPLPDDAAPSPGGPSTQTQGPPQQPPTPGLPSQPPGGPGPAPPPSPPAPTPQGQQPPQTPQPSPGQPTSPADHWRTTLTMTLSDSTEDSPEDQWQHAAMVASVVDPNAAWKLVQSGRTSLSKIRESFPDFPDLSGNSKARAARQLFVDRLRTALDNDQFINDIRRQIGLPEWSRPSQPAPQQPQPPGASPPPPAPASAPPLPDPQPAPPQPAATTPPPTAPPPAAAPPAPPMVPAPTQPQSPPALPPTATPPQGPQPTPSPAATPAAPVVPQSPPAASMPPDAAPPSVTPPQPTPTPQPPAQPAPPPVAPQEPPQASTPKAGMRGIAKPPAPTGSIPAGLPVLDEQGAEKEAEKDRKRTVKMPPPEPESEPSQGPTPPAGEAPPVEETPAPTAPTQPTADVAPPAPPAPPEPTTAAPVTEQAQPAEKQPPPPLKRQRRRPDEPIPPYTRTTPARDSDERAHTQEMAQKYREIERREATRRRELEKQKNSMRRNAHKKRAEIQGQINAFARDEAAAARQAQKYEFELAAMKIEDVAENPPSLEHYWSAMGELEKIKAQRQQVLFDNYAERMAEDKQRVDDRVRRMHAEQAKAHYAKADEYYAKLIDEIDAIAAEVAVDLNPSEQKSLTDEAWREFGPWSRRSLEQVVADEAEKRRKNRYVNVESDVARLTRLSAERRAQVEADLRAAIASGGVDWWKQQEAVLAAAKQEDDAIAEQAKQEALAEAERKRAEAEENARVALRNMRQEAHAFGKEARFWDDLSDRGSKIKGTTRDVTFKEGEQDITLPGEVLDDQWAIVERGGKAEMMRKESDDDKQEKGWLIVHVPSGRSMTSNTKANAKQFIQLLRELGLDRVYAGLDSDAMAHSNTADMMAAGKAMRAWNNSDLSHLDDETRSKLLSTVATTPTTVKADIVLDSFDFGLHTQKHPRLGKLFGRGYEIVKSVSDAVPEFSYDPVLVSDGTNLIYRDGQKFTFAPRLFNLHPSEVPKGTTVGINLEDLGIARNTANDVVTEMMKSWGLKTSQRKEAIAVSVGPMVVLVKNTGTESAPAFVAESSDAKAAEKVQKIVDGIRWTQPGQETDWPNPNRARGADVGRYLGEGPARAFDTPAGATQQQQVEKKGPEKKPKRKKKAGDAAGDGESGGQVDSLRLTPQNVGALPLEMSDRPGAEQPYHPTQIIAQLRSDMGIAIDRGRVQDAKALGTYNNHSEAIRHQKGREGALGVIAHEVAHHVDKTHSVVKGGGIGLMPQPVVDELRRLDYDPTKKRAFEGFAEFVRYWSTLTTADIQQKAPNTAAWWDQWLRDNPDTAAKLNRYRDMVQQYIDAGPQARRAAARAGTARSQFPLAMGQSSVAPNTPPLRTSGTVTDWFHRQWTWWLSRFTDKTIAGKAFDNEVRARGGDYDPVAGQMSVHDAMLDAATAQSRGQLMTLQPLVSPDGTRVLHPGLAQAVQDSKLHPDTKEYEDWAWYYQSRMLLEIINRDPEYRGGIDIEDAKDIVNKVDTAAALPAGQSHPSDPTMTSDLARRIKTLSDDVTHWFNALLAWSAAMGVVTPDAAAAMLTTWGQVYAPQWRQATNDDASSLFMPTKFLQAASPFRRLSRKGSELPYVDPLQVAVAKAGAVSVAASHRAADLSLLDAIKSTEGLGKLAQIVKPEVRWIETALDNMLKSLEEAKALAHPVPVIRAVNRVRNGLNITRKTEQALANHFGITVDWNDQQSIDTFYDLIRDDVHGPAADVPDVTKRVGFWRPVLEASPQERIVAMRDRSGKVVLVQMDPMLHEVFQQRFDSPIPNVFLRVLMSYSWLQRLGAITLSPSFMLTNPGRDIWGVMAGAPVGNSTVRGMAMRLLRQPASLAKALVNATFPKLAKRALVSAGVSPMTAERVVSNPLWEAYERTGLTSGNPLGKSQASLSEGQQKLFDMGYVDRMVSDVRNGRIGAAMSDTFDAVTGWAAASDSMGRYVAYVDALHEMGYTLDNNNQIVYTDKAGKSRILKAIPEAASRTAAIRARETGPDFFRSGRFRSVVGPLFGTFMWANVAGWDHLRRTIALAAFDPRPAVRAAAQKRLAVAVAGMAIMAAAYWLTVHDKDWYKELRKRGSKDLRRKNFFFGDDNGVTFTFPKGYQWGIVSNSVIDALDAAEDQVKGGGLKALRDDLGDATVDVLMELLPTGGPPEQMLSAPPFIGPMLDAMRNTQWDQRRPIVPKDLERLSPHLQVRPDTSSLAVGVGNTLGVSPLQAEYVMNQVTGGALRRYGKTYEALQSGEPGEAMRRMALSGYVPSFDPNQSVNDAYELAGTLRQRKTDAIFTRKPLSADEEYSLRTMTAATDMISKIRQSMRGAIRKDARSDRDHLAVGTARSAMGDEPLNLYQDALHKDTALPADLEPARTEIVASFVRDLTADRPTSVTKLEKAKGGTLPDKVRDWQQERADALRWLSDHGYTKDDVASMYVKAAKAAGTKPETIGRNLGEIRRAWK